MTQVNCNWLFNSCDGYFTEIHLPANVDSIGIEFCQGGFTLDTLWFGSAEKPRKGVMDFRGSAVTTMSSKSFNLVGEVDTVIIPDTLTSIDNNSFANSSVKSIIQITEKNNDGISTAANSSGIDYYAVNFISSAWSNIFVH